jgi:hydrogenase maturation protein HypF
MEVRRQIQVSGIVQGVGFRPYVYRLAVEHQLTGNIVNTSSGVTIEVQGQREAVEDFVVRLPQEAPPLARVMQVAVVERPCNGDREFRILASRKGEATRTLISPDVAVCDDCLRELLDPTNRRYRYPFINCTNCGPRFTIVRNIPYDRQWTSMAVFSMCPACQKE